MKTPKTIIVLLLMLVSSITMAQTGKWFPVPGANFNGNIYTIAFAGDTLYVGGTFTMASGDTANRIARWDGTTWSTIGTGFNNVVNKIVINGGNIYAGGNFGMAGGNSIIGIAKWNGANWSALGSGVSGSVQSILVDGNDFYVGGGFSNAGGNPANGIAKWDGTAWSALASGTGVVVYGIAKLGGILYAAGTFSVSGSRIAKWNGTNWSSPGSGLNSTTVSLVVHGNDLYAGGNFTMAGGNPANNIARWNGTNWDSLGSGLNSIVHGIEVIGNDFYVGGNFTQAGGNPANRVARWDGTSWDSVGSGLNNRVRVVVYHKNNLYVGGDFTIAGGDSASHLARYVFAPVSPQSLSLNVLDTGVVKLTWADSSDYEDGFVLERKDNTDTSWTAIDSLEADSVTYTDSGLIIGRTYEYRVYAYNEGGNSGYSNIVSSLITGIVGNSSLPDKYAIYQNYPNPFNPSTKIKFDIPKSGIVKLTIYDILGRQVSTLVNNELTAGRYEMEWSAGKYSSGMYFYRIEAEGFVETKRMMLVK